MLKITLLSFLSKPNADIADIVEKILTTQVANNLVKPPSRLYTTIKGKMKEMADTMITLMITSDKYNLTGKSIKSFARYALTKFKRK